jgi:hypothetical protein
MAPSKEHQASSESASRARRDTSTEPANKLKRILLSTSYSFFRRLLLYQNQLGIKSFLCYDKTQHTQKSDVERFAMATSPKKHSKFFTATHTLINPIGIN